MSAVHDVQDAITVTHHDVVGVLVVPALHEIVDLLHLLAGVALVGQIECQNIHRDVYLLAVPGDEAAVVQCGLNDFCLGVGSQLLATLAKVDGHAALVGNARLDGLGSRLERGLPESLNVLLVLHSIVGLHNEILLYICILSLRKAIG